jgi:hypothetical protein
MTNCDEELSGLANVLVFNYVGEINVEHNDGDDKYLQITPTDTVNLNNALKRVKNKISNLSKESDNTYIIKNKEDQLFVKVVENPEEFDDWIVLE